VFLGGLREGGEWIRANRFSVLGIYNCTKGPISRRRLIYMKREYVRG